MALTEEEVRHIAKLARLGLSDEEVKKFSNELSSVLEYIKVLEELDTDKVEPTAQVTGLSNVSYADEVESNFCNREELLASTPLPVEKEQIKVQKVLE